MAFIPFENVDDIKNNTADCKSVKINMITDFHTIIKNVAKELNTSVDILVHTFFTAILTGDIIIERSFRNTKAFKATVTEDPSVTLLTLKDKEGNIINPSLMTDELQDMYFGVFKLKDTKK